MQPSAALPLRMHCPCRKARAPCPATQQMGAATGAIFTLAAAASEMGILYEAAEQARERRQQAGGDRPLSDAVAALRERLRIAARHEPPF